MPREIFFVDENICIGCHIQKEKSLTQSIFNVQNMKINCAQIYISSPRGFEVKYPEDADMKAVKELCSYVNFRVYIHACLLYNLAGGTNFSTIDDLIKNAKTSLQKEKFLKEKERMPVNLRLSRDNLKKELDISAKCGFKGVVLHIGSSVDTEQAIKRIAENINTVLQNCEGALLLENSAGEGNKIGKNLQEIVKIFKLLDPTIVDKVKVCIDTCHLFSAGDYDIREVDIVKKFFKDFDTLFKPFGGIKKLGLIHLNDSLGKFGSKKDRHATLGEGEIFKGDGIKALKTIIRFCCKLKIDMILETPSENHEKDVDLVCGLCG